MKKKLNIILSFSFSLLFFSLTAQPDVIFPQYLTGFTRPVDIENAGDGTDRLFIVEQRGIIKIIENDAEVSTPFLDITSIVRDNGNEQGLLGLAFHPDYETNGYFYVNYTDNGSDTNISRFEVDASDANLADPDSELIILEIDQPYSNHNAGDIAFSPIDGYLYISLGDGGSGGDPGNRSQDGLCLLGKMLRIDVDGGGDPASPSQGGGCAFTSTSNYTIPSDNPFVGDINVLDEIWSQGLRNAWRFSFDSANGDMWIADVGQGAWEEVSYEKNGTGGANYGWRCYEGDHEYNSGGSGDCNEAYIDPVFEYDHSQSGGYSITGGYVYRGTEFPNMVGYYVLADYSTENVWTLFRDSEGVVTSQSHDVSGINSISTFGVDEAGEIYAAGLGGTIYKVEDNSPLPVQLSSLTGFHEAGVNFIRWTTESERNSDYFEIEKSEDGVTFHSLGNVKATGGNSFESQAYQYKDQQPQIGQNYYRLKIVDKDGGFDYSELIEITIEKPFTVAVHPNPNNGKFSLISNDKITQKVTLKIFSTTGEEILRTEADQTNAFQKTFDLSDQPKGIYLIQISSDNFSETIKMVIR